MAYLWQDYSPDNVYAAEYDCESVGEENSSRGADRKFINPALRFQDIFAPLANANWPGQASLKPVIEDVFFHILACLDTLSGVRQLTLAENRIRRTMVEGVYGPHIQRIFQELEPSEQESILYLFYQRQKNQNRHQYFLHALRAIFPCAVAYYNEEDGRTLVFLPLPRTQVNIDRIAILEALFLDLDSLPVKYYWHRHFGIIGRSATMRIDHIVIYGNN